MSEKSKEDSLDFIRSVIAHHNETGQYKGRVVTRFPPEPNGYLHIGHAKAIVLSHGLAQENPGGVFHLRFDDTNPEKENIEYVDAILRDIKWLGCDPLDKIFFASDYYETLYGFAVRLIKSGKAYVCSLSIDQIREYRGSVTEPGKESPFRDRTIAENLDLFGRMRKGEFEEGTHVLRAKIDMSAANMQMRDPLLYRIRYTHHFRAGDAWCIYPMYDFAHCLSDSIEQITHSICTLEFENNREVYDWLVEHVGFDEPPKQYEFAKLLLTQTVLGKRRLVQMVQEDMVSGWDDPRMPTITGLRRRGYTASAIRNFLQDVGIAKTNSVVDLGRLENAIRNELNTEAPRVMCVLDPIRVIIENYPEGQVEEFDVPHFPHGEPKAESRKVPFTREVFIERSDFMETPSKGFYRLAPGQEVRLRSAYFIRCESFTKDPETGQLIDIRCSYDPASRGGSSPDGRKVKGTLHWVSADKGLPVLVRNYGPLFADDTPDTSDIRAAIDPDSLVLMPNAIIEPSVGSPPFSHHYQFERQGYYCRDVDHLNPQAQDDERALVMNRVVPLRDSWDKKDAPKKDTPPPKKKAVQPRSVPAQPKTIVPPTDPHLAARFHHYVNELGLPPDRSHQLTRKAHTSMLFDDATNVHNAPDSVSKWLVNVCLGEPEVPGAKPISGHQVGTIVALLDAGTVSGSGAKKLLELLRKVGGDPKQLVDEHGLHQLDDSGELEPIVARVIAENPEALERYRNGEQKLFGFFVGQVMRATGGKGNGKLIAKLLNQALRS